MKIINFRKKIKVFVPVILLFLISGSLIGYFVSPSGQTIFQNYSYLDAGYDQNFKVPILKNNYKNLNNLQAGNFKIISYPDTKTIQSLDLTNNQITLSNLANSVSFNIKKFQNNLKNDIAKTKVIYKASMNEKQFKNLLNYRYLAQLGLLFNVKLSGFDFNQNKMSNIEYNNLITGFEFNDLSLIKEKTYPIFDYAVNNDFSNLVGNIKGFFHIQITPEKIFNLSISIQATPILAQEWNNQIKENKFKIEFFSPNKNENFKPILFWNTNQNNDLSKWFWPIPLGPIQDPKVITTKEDSKTVNPNQYNVIFKPTYKNETAYFFKYNKVDNFNKPINKEQKEENAVKIVFDQDKWQKNFFNDWNKLVPLKNPGIKIQLNLDFSVFDAQYGQVQKYNSFVFTFFQFDKLLNSNTFEQQFVDYDLGLGRINNSGKFKLKAIANINLQKQLVVTFSAYGNDLSYTTSKKANAWDVNKFKSEFKFDQIQISSFYDSKSDKKININQIVPLTAFIKDVRSSNQQSIRKSENVTRDSDKDGEQSHQNFWQPYLFKFNTLWSSWYTEDLASYTENNSKFLNKSYLTFNFVGNGQTNNKTNINLRSPSDIQQLIWYQPGFKENKIKLPESTKVQLAKYSDSYNSFSIPYSMLTPTKKNLNSVIYTWKEMFTFDKENYGRNNFNKELFEFKNYRNNSNYSAMRSRFLIELKKVNEFSFAYRLGTSVTAYQWNSSSESASNGTVGYVLDSIKINIK